MSLKKWAKHEVEIAKSNNNDEYYNRCLDAALEVFEKLCNQGHSGMSVSITAGILNRLIDTKPLTPIDDTADVWNEVGTNEYQCTRYSGLFKTITTAKDISGISYSDVNRFVCYDDSAPSLPFTSGIVTRALDKSFPITMPYFPEHIKVMVHESLANPKNGDFDTVHIISVEMPDGKIIEINKTLKEVDGVFVEIAQQMDGGEKECYTN